jgi:hypothetical protein
VERANFPADLAELIKQQVVNNEINWNLALFHSASTTPDFNKPNTPDNTSSPIPPPVLSALRRSRLISSAPFPVAWFRKCNKPTKFAGLLLVKAGKNYINAGVSCLATNSKWIY